MRRIFTQKNTTLIFRWRFIIMNPNEVRKIAREEIAMHELRFSILGAFMAIIAGLVALGCTGRL
jgi:hypothetical protein